MRAPAGCGEPTAGRLAESIGGFFGALSEASLKWTLVWGDGWATSESTPDFVA